MFDAPAPPWKPTPVVHLSPATPRAAPLDLASASLGQDGTKFKLLIRTRGTYDAAALRARGRRVLCLDLVYGHEKAGLCVASLRGDLVLRRVPGSAAPIAATVTRKGTRLTAKFTPAD